MTRFGAVSQLSARTPETNADFGNGLSFGPAQTPLPTFTLPCEVRQHGWAAESGEERLSRGLVSVHGESVSILLHSHKPAARRLHAQDTEVPILFPNSVQCARSCACAALTRHVQMFCSAYSLPWWSTMSAFAFHLPRSRFASASMPVSDIFAA